jgi:hypothetical protein
MCAIAIGGGYGDIQVESTGVATDDKIIPGSCRCRFERRVWRSTADADGEAEGEVEDDSTDDVIMPEEGTSRFEIYNGKTLMNRPH